MQAIPAIIALGSNQGDSIAILNQAVDKIAQISGVKLYAVSPFYRTKPWGYTDQPDFINGVIKVETSLSGSQLYAHLSALEQEFKRIRLFKNGPRTLDLDIITYGESVSQDPDLTLPHPRAHERAFVLVPLCDIAPETYFANFKCTALELLNKLPQSEREGMHKL